MPRQEILFILTPGSHGTWTNPMSALGQKQTCAVQNGMSALPPIATAKADIRKRSCPARAVATNKILGNARGGRGSLYRLRFQGMSQAVDLPSFPIWFSPPLTDPG